MSANPTSLRRILITGAAGVIGSSLRASLTRGGEIVRLTDRQPMTAEGESDEVAIGDLTDPGFVDEVCCDVDAIVHMAGNPKEKPWGELIAPNITASILLWEAARRQGVKRIVYGSSNHVLGLYRTDTRLDGTFPPLPDSRYGVTKLFGEGLASLYAYKYGIKGFCIRIGTFRERPESARELSTWISPRDLVALVRTGLDADYVFETVFGVSSNTRAWCDNSRAIALGYRPSDDAEAFADHIAQVPASVPRHPVANVAQGGGSAAQEFSGDIDWLPRGPRP